MKTTFIIILSVITLLALGWVLTIDSLEMQRVFAPKFEQVRRETFEQSKAYRQGEVQELQNMQFAYLQTDKEHRGALASVIRQRAADFPHDQMPNDLRNFIESL